MNESDPGEVGEQVDHSVELSDDSYGSLLRMALRHGVSVEDELVQVIGDKELLEQEIASGAELLLRRPNGDIERIKFAFQQAPLGDGDRLEPDSPIGN